MIEVFLNNNLPPGWHTILRQHDLGQLKNPELTLQLEISRQAFNTLFDWGLPSGVAEAVLLASLIEYESVHLQASSEPIQQESTELAKQLISWHASIRS